MTGLERRREITVVTTDGEELYRRSGVDLGAAARAVDMIRELARATPDLHVRTGVGGFAGLVELGDGRLLAAATDGVGTKIEVARLTGKLDTVGIDLVAMCANDVVCTGAEPLFFLDYLAVGKVVAEEVATIVSGVAEGCRRAGCALLGGETAEHPGTMQPGQFDLAGFCVGIVDEGRVLDPASVRPGDALLGLLSTGLHSNGYSLIRREVVRDRASLGEHVPELGRTLGEELLEPTAVYVRPLLSLIRAGVVRSAANITGGGLPENVPRALPPNLGAVVTMSGWRVPPVFRFVARRAGCSPNDLFAVLNMGIGMVAVVPSGSEDRALSEAKAAGFPAAIVGRVERGSGVRVE